MPSLCTIYGGLARRGQPMQGMIKFIPSTLWVLEDGVPWACLSPEVELDEEGGFSVQVSATDTGIVWWKYRLEVPNWWFEFSVPYKRSSYSLKELISVDHSGTSS